MKNIIFDIDGTITEELLFLKKHAVKYLNKKYGEKFDIVNPNGYTVSEIFGLREYLEKNGYDKIQIEKETRYIDSDFWNKNFVKYMFFPIKKDSNKIIKDLKKKGYTINFVSLRGKITHQNETYIQSFIRKKIVPLITKLQLICNKIKYDKLILVKDNNEKLLIAKEIEAKYVIDDDVEVLEKLDSTIRGICIETSNNSTYIFQNPNIRKIKFSQKNVINSINTNKNNKNKQTIKNIKLYQKLYTESFYKLVRTFGKHSVIKNFNPIIIGEENIPREKQEKASVFVGNHRDIKDPLITIACIKQPTHFAALKRMFEYNENMFGKVGNNLGTIATTFLVKSIGALPIARKTDENYMHTNLQTFNYINDYIKLNSNIAIYPEGTLNRMPTENGNILPLKSDYSFKIAEHGKAIIRPVAIVWIPKELGLENKVLIAFLNPIYTENLDSNEIAEKWNIVMNDAINSMNKIINEMTKISIDSEKIKTLTKNIKKL